MILKLNAIFETYNKVAKSNTQLHNPNFDINIHNKREIFKSFYARFITTITPLNYTNILKISNLKRLITIRLKYRISEENFSSYQNLIARLRYITANLKIIDKTTSFRDKNKIKNAREKTIAIKTSSST